MKSLSEIISVHFLKLLTKAAILHGLPRMYIAGKGKRNKPCKRNIETIVAEAQERLKH